VTAALAAAMTSGLLFFRWDGLEMAETTPAWVAWLCVFASASGVDLASI
jgi:hypothetical protein